MQTISEQDIKARINRDNPWWDKPHESILEAAYPRRVYFSTFKNLALDFDVRRATILLGPRRVGKTVIIKQLVHDAIQQGIDPKSILYASIDAPIYSGISLERFLDFMPKDSNGKRVVLFDEIQYLPNWEVHMKDLVDNHSNTKFIATGSAAAALRLKSRESGAGRFSEFMLPPLTFYEFLMFTGKDDALIERTDEKKRKRYRAKNIDALNESFIDYLNFGGYPEAVLNEAIRRNAEQFIRSDIIDKVLLKDLPSLYGINEIQELNRLFSFLAYNTGNEASLENISQESGITKPTIKKYIEYLESAFLIIKLSTVDDNCRTMKRERTFKVYLSNPSMRAALFAPVTAAETDKVGHLVESAILSQWQHSTTFRQIRYARWRNEGEVDVVFLEENQKPGFVGEIKWSDRLGKQFDDETRSMQLLLRRHPNIRQAFFTTRTIDRRQQLEGRELIIMPSAVYCYTVGRNITSSVEPPQPVPPEPASPQSVSPEPVTDE